MAKNRTRGGAARGAPKPKIQPRKTPLMKRRGAKWVPVVLLAILAAVVTPLVLGRMHRSDVLRQYDVDLGRAVRPFEQHLAETVPDSFVNIPAQFAQGTITPRALQEAAERWQRDFAQAGNNVRGLSPPEQLRDANELVALALEDFAGLAGQYLVLAESQRVANQAGGAEARRLQDQISAWMGQIDQARNRAEASLSYAFGRIQELKVAWGISPPPPPPEEPQAPDFGDLDLGDLDLGDIDIPPEAIPHGGVVP